MSKVEDLSTAFGVAQNIREFIAETAYSEKLRQPEEFQDRCGYLKRYIDYLSAEDMVKDDRVLFGAGKELVLRKSIDPKRLWTPGAVGENDILETYGGLRTLGLPRVVGFIMDSNQPWPTEEFYDDFLPDRFNWQSLKNNPIHLRLALCALDDLLRLKDMTHAQHRKHQLIQHIYQRVGINASYMKYLQNNFAAFPEMAGSVVHAWLFQ